MHGTGEVKDKDFGYLSRKLGLKGKETDATTTNKTLAEERMTYTREGEKVGGFASAQVPTLEEKTIAEHRPRDTQADSKPILDVVEESKVAQPDVPKEGAVHETRPETTQKGHNEEISGDKPTPPADGVHPDRLRLFQPMFESDGNVEVPAQARVHDGSEQLFGAPANAKKDAKTDDEFPRGRSAPNDPSQQEKDAVAARAVLRRHLSPSVGNHPWTLPVPGPEIDPHGFDDPISEKFWDNIWITSAVHNVSCQVLNVDDSR